MKLIESKVEVIDQLPGLEGVYKQVELAGRTCYKSEDKITENSAKEFVDRMIKLGHGAMLEHGTVYLEIPEEVAGKWVCCRFSDYEHNKYSKVIYHQGLGYWFITTNLRVLVEKGWLDDLQYACEPTAHHEKRITARFTCDRGVSHEIVRHRVMSFAQESQRYIGYDKEKFGSEITFIKPHWYDEEFPACLTWVEGLKEAEKKYMELREIGLKPQDARGVLPNATKTEIVVTGFESDWKHFFELRTSGAAHPDMRKLAINLKEQLYGFDEKTEGCGESSGTNDVTSTAA